MDLTLLEDRLLVEVDSPFYDDPPPHGPARSLDGLWEFEVVELFLLGESRHYLELELSPHGHYLALQLQGCRVRVSEDLPLEVHCEVRGQRWTGSATIPGRLLPEGLHSCNAYAIHGIETRRRYLAAYPVRGSQPDFHRLDRFRALDW